MSADDKLDLWEKMEDAQAAFVDAARRVGQASSLIREREMASMNAASKEFIELARRYLGVPEERLN